ncbi:MAG: DUF4457 domain-containing protein [Pirellulales bacterium]
MYLQRVPGQRCLLIILTAFAAVGCQQPADSPTTATTAREDPAAANEPPGVEAKSPANPSRPVVKDEPDPAVDWGKLIATARAQIESNQPEEALETINQAKQLYPEPQKLNPPQQEQLASLEASLSNLQEAEDNRVREKKLADAEQLMNRGKFVAATQSINDVLSRGPSDNQRQRAGVLADEIERRRRAQRDLLSWMQLLESTDRREIATAQVQLSRDVDTALSLLVEATERVDKPVLVRNSLSLLRQLNRPAAAVPAILAVLTRGEQQENWSDAVSELGKFTGPGAGKPLLELALGADDSAQRSAALMGLRQVVDPPRHTLVALLPLLEQDGEELTSALQAARHAVTVHRQFDLLSRRGLDVELSPQQEQSLASLPVRLKAIIASGSEEAGTAAKILACATRQLEPQPLEGVKVARAVAEAEDGPAAAVLDGVWNSVELNTMWRHPINQQSMIELDLGKKQLVTGIRIWNFNEPSNSHRGWKDVHIYVGDSPARMRLVSKGIVPQAPGAAETADYSTLVPIDFAQGRYVRLVGKSTWQPESHTGLAELQILGL